MKDDAKVIIACHALAKIAYGRKPGYTGRPRVIPRDDLIEIARAACNQLGVAFDENGRRYEQRRRA